MLDQSPNLHFPTMKRVVQITDAHCGPAVVEMLLSFHGLNIDQRQIVESTGIGYKIRKYGMLVSEMGHAIKRLTPHLDFWHREDSRVAEMSQIVNIHRYPVGIGWQGVFLEYADYDDGHYSVVTNVDLEKGALKIADPFEPFAGVDREFTVREFEPRWWDVDEVVNSVTGQVKHFASDRVMFMVTPREVAFPELLGMHRA